MTAKTTASAAHPILSGEFFGFIAATAGVTGAPHPVQCRAPVASTAPQFWQCISVGLYHEFSRQLDVITLFPTWGNPPLGRGKRRRPSLSSVSRRCRWRRLAVPFDHADCLEKRWLVSKN